jgi:hypothetical protein
MTRVERIGADQNQNNPLFGFVFIRENPPNPRHPRPIFG